MKYKTGDKCIVKPESKNECVFLGDLDFDYIEIKSINFEHEYYTYKAIRNEAVVGVCSCYKDKDLLPYKPKKDIANIDTYAVGDVLISSEEIVYRVLGICEEIVFIGSMSDINEGTPITTTAFGLSNNGYKFKDQEEEIIELTLEDIAKLKGVDVSKIKIKK